MSASPESETLYCYNHPNVATTLRCNRCERPICAQCAVLTPTGYRCRECVRGQQKVFDTTRSLDIPVAVIIAGALGFGGSLIARSLGFWIIFIAPVAGVVIAEVVRWAVRRRRSPTLYKAAAIGAAAGSLLPVLYTAYFLLILLTGGQGGTSFFLFLPLIYQVVFTVLMTSAFYTRLSGIQIRR